MSRTSAVDLVLFNARVLTLDPIKPAASVVAITGDRIVGVSDDKEPWAGPDARLIDCGGKTIVPGFNDAHCHVLAYVQSLFSLDFSPPRVTSIEQMKSLLRQRAADSPPGTWIIATGYDEFYLSEKRHPTRWDFDEAAPRNPVRVLHRSGHAQVLNSVALVQAGIGMETPEPPGALIDRDLDSGEPNGLLFEMNSYVAEKMPPMHPDELKKGLALANRNYLSQGITSLQDASVRNGLAQWELFQELKAARQLIPRLTLMPGYTVIEEFERVGLSPGMSDADLRLGAVKIVLDECTGSLFPAQPDLNEIVLRLHTAGYQLAIHAIDAVEAAATALEYALQRHPREHRHRIEHCSVCPPKTLERLGKLGVIVVTQPPFIYWSGERYLSEVPKEQAPWLYRVRSFKDAGLRPAASSDSPVANISPLIGIYAAVTRLSKDGHDVLSTEAVSVTEALEMYTSAAAYASYEETEKGTITPGKLADLAVLDRDPTAISPEELKDIKVEMTLLGSEVLWGGV